MDELARFFEELKNSYEISNFQNKQLRKEKGRHESLLSLQKNRTSHSRLPISTSDYIKEVAQEEEGLEGRLGSLKNRV